MKRTKKLTKQERKARDAASRPATAAVQAREHQAQANALVDEHDRTGVPVQQVAAWH